MNSLISRKGTGTADELAERLGICWRSVYNYIDKLRMYGADIEFCHERNTYFYTDDIQPRLPIVSKLNSRDIHGGESYLINILEVHVFCTSSLDLCIRYSNHHEQNNASGFGQLVGRY
jgi:hypothetical protein